nr:hypothetical protein [Tanacetum cinerariifolium]
MAFRNFIYTEDDDDLAFLPKEPSPGYGTGSPCALVNMELPKDAKKLEVQPAEIIADSRESPKAGMFIVHRGSVAARIKERKCKTRGCSSRPPVKRKLASGSSSSRVGRAKTSASKDDAPIFSISDTMKASLTVLSLKMLMHAVVDNVVNMRAREFLQVIEKMSGEADVIKARERSRTEECEELRVKCKAAMAEFDQNPVEGYQATLLTLESKVDYLEAEKAKLEAVESSLRKEVKELKQDRRDVVSKVVPYGATELVHSDELGKLVGYHSSYKKEYTQASNDFATATFPWLDEFVVDAASSIDALLSKKPSTLQKPAPSRTQIYVPSS